MKKEKRWTVMKKLTVMADYGCGLWNIEGKGVYPDNVEINAPAEFVERFEKWVDWYWDNIDGKLDIENFNKEGRALAVELKRIVGSSYKVVFKSEPDLVAEEITGEAEK